MGRRGREAGHGQAAQARSGTPAGRGSLGLRRNLPHERTTPLRLRPASPVLSIVLYRKRLAFDLRLLKSRQKCPLLQLGWGSFPGGLCFKSPVKGPAAKPLSPPRRAGCSPSRFGAGAGGRGGAPGAQVVLPLLQAAPPGVHEEVADGGELQAQLLGDGDLHFFGGALVLLEDGEERSALEVREHQARFLLGVVPLFVRLLLFAFAGWGRGGQRQRERERQDACGCPRTPQPLWARRRARAAPSRSTRGAWPLAEPAPCRQAGAKGLGKKPGAGVVLASQRPAFS